MKNESVKTVKDKKSFEKVFNGIFNKFQPFIKNGKLVTRVKFVSYSDDKVVFEIEDYEITEKEYCIQCRDDSANTFYADLEFIEKEDENAYLFSPLEIRIEFTPRQEERITLDAENNVNHRLYIINMISEYVIKQSFEINSKKLIAIENVIKVKLEKMFDLIKLYFLKSANDPRMTYFKGNIKPVFIPNVNAEPADNFKDVFNYYKEYIYNDDYQISSNKYISEISIPLVYRMKIPYGYVQVNSRTSFMESSMSVVKKIASVVNELMIKHNLFPQTKDKIAVSDVSQNGLGLKFKDKQYIKYFFKDQLVYFDLVLPGSTKVNILASINNINIFGTIYKVGCKIVEIDALSEVNYYEYLQSIGLTINE